MPGELQTSPESSSRGATDFIRGAAILLVIVSHYALTYHNDFYQKHLYEYASMGLAVFFVLSGYGLYHSLERRFAAGAPLKTILGRFYFDRAFRIFVPYWFALFLFSFLPDSAILHGFNGFAIKAYLGFPVMYWFVTAILQCYLVAPFLYLLLKKKGPAVFAGLLVAAFALLMMISDRLNARGLMTNDLVQDFTYRFLVLGNVVFFAAGLMIPWFVSRLGSSIRNTGLILLSLGALLISLYMGRSGLALYPLFVISGAGLCAFMIARQPSLPLGQAMGFIGRHSFPLYLFHRPFFIVLVWIGLISEGRISGAVYTLLLSPFLLCFCVVVERCTKRAHRYVSSFRPRDRLAESEQPAA